MRLPTGTRCSAGNANAGRFAHQNAHDALALCGEISDVENTGLNRYIRFELYHHRELRVGRVNRLDGGDYKDGALLFS